MIILKPDAEHGVGEKLHNLSAHFKQFFFGHNIPNSKNRAAIAPIHPK
ncbi:hypothetical protein EBBID32_21710 [Sphingobium indicum BiD32]|uniref:Uncharacterized protein n=1 Tax=Sphingobium indicum BiD32 TaxID=1301087 RepID=N1MQA0_9SPHN|nr:hypothetical protein EBBID32_21710 [Sphingobium indicum BiD32]